MKVSILGVTAAFSLVLAANVGALPLNLYGDTEITTSSTNSVIKTYNTSTINIVDGADVSYLKSYDDSNANISGGRVSWAYAYDSSNYDITGGDISWLHTYGTSEIDITGGDIGWLQTYDTSEIDIRSMDSLSWLITDQDSQVNIFGSDFYFENGRLSGLWEDGSSFSFWTSAGSVFTQSSVLQDNIVLHNTVAPTPEPATVLLFGAGISGLVAIRRRRAGVK